MKSSPRRYTPCVALPPNAVSYWPLGPAEMQNVSLDQPRGVGMTIVGTIRDEAAIAAPASVAIARKTLLTRYRWPHGSGPMGGERYAPRQPRPKDGPGVFSLFKSPG